jgi:hypothetical protein
VDPVTDPRYPRITHYNAPRHDPSWPRGWGDEPTHRDQLGFSLDTLLGNLTLPIRSAHRVSRGAVVNLGDFRSAAVKGWGGGWPLCQGAAGNIVSVYAARSNARFNVHRRIAVLVDALIDRMEARGYLCKPAQCGAFNCRPIAGTQTSSNHAWGLALDINWTDNPYTSTGRRLIPDWVADDIFNPYGFAWGGDYTTQRKDFMHLEFLGSPTQADQMTALLTAGDGDGWRTLKVTTPRMTGDDVRAVQRVLRAWYSLPADFIDGHYGPGTERVVRRAQEGVPPHPKLTADGVVGPLTYRKLGLIA